MKLEKFLGAAKRSLELMPSIYVHLSGRDTDASILGLYGIKVEKTENQLEKAMKECPFCGHDNSPNAKFCEECNGPLDSVTAENVARKNEEKESLTKEFIKSLIEEKPEVIEDILSEGEMLQKIRDLDSQRAEA